MSAIGGIATTKVSFCPKLLGNLNLFGESRFAAFCVVKRLGDSNLYGTVLPQGIGEIEFARSCFASSIGESQFAAFLRLQAFWEFQPVGYCLASSYWGITISYLLSCAKVLGNYNLQGLASRRIIGEFQFAVFCVSKLLGSSDLQCFNFAPSYWGGSSVLSS